MSTNYYRGVEDKPYHLSVGAVLMNDQGQVACHHFEKIRGYEDIYILMRETMEPGESIDEALARGLMEEFGATAKIRTFLGSTVVDVTDSPTPFEKTTLYFVCDLIEMDNAKRLTDDPEAGSTVMWKEIPELQDLMKAQGKRYDLSDIDESEVLDRL